MTFLSRAQAGQLLGERLRVTGARADLVLGLPRGGVVVAAEVARILGAPLATLVVRKIGHPRQREFAVGALAEPDEVVLDAESLQYHTPTRAALEAVEREEKERLREYQRRFHPDGMPDLTNKHVWLVDDGLATGATMDAAVRAARKRNVVTVKVAVPVMSMQAMNRISRLADEIVALVAEEEFMAVGRYYENFAQVSDEEVISLLRRTA